MSKPDDIPQDVWDTAIKCAETVCRNLPDDYGDVTIEVTVIARAIMAERDAILTWSGNTSGMSMHLRRPPM